MHDIGYFQAININTCSLKEKIHQKKVVKIILAKKGFTKKWIKDLKTQISLNEETKKFIGRTVFENVNK